MSTTIAISWSEPEIQFVVARNGQIQAAAAIVVTPSQDPSTVGQRLSEALATHSPSKAKTIVAIDRKALEWQLLSLPPCPTEELPDLVRLQADQDPNTSEEDVGFDFLPLVGDEQTPYQVLTVAMPAGELSKIQQVCHAAGLTLEHIVPLAIGWPVITEQFSPKSNTGTNIFVTPFAREATLWATQEGQVTLLRQLQLPETEDPKALTSVMNNELRRTLLALSQQTDKAVPTISLVGEVKAKLTTLSDALENQHGISTRTVELISSKQLPLPADVNSYSSALPLSGLAKAEAYGTRPLVDLLHPRQRATGEKNIRTYVLAGTAALLLALMASWQGYSNLQAPLEQASLDQIELTILEEPLEDLGKYEQRTGAIRDWNAEAANVLVHLRKVGESVRTKTLESEDFPLDQDVVLEKFLLERRNLTIDAMARNSQAVQPLEARLRSNGYRPQRGKSEPSKVIEGYPWHFKSTIEITSDSDSASGPATEEPQS